MKTREQIIKEITALAKRMRGHVLDMALASGSSSSHVGGGLSFVDIAATLYGAIMKYDPAHPEWADRDRFILSKGHGVLGYYAALAETGFIPEGDLKSIKKEGTYLLGHPVMNRSKGIEFSTGSLGMGLSLGIGVALAGKRKGRSYRVYVVLGDGECNEGSVWEAAMAACQFRIGNLIAVIDKNRFQQTGPNSEIMSVGDMTAKWKSFGWETEEVDGHDVGALYDSLSRQVTDQPRAIIAHTTKGKGCSFAENNNDWHHATLTQAQYEIAIKELNPLP